MDKFTDLKNGEQKCFVQRGLRKEPPPAVESAAGAVNIGNQGDETMPHRIDRCAIPVKDLDRAIRFYSAVLGSPVKKVQFHNKAIGLLTFGGGEYIGFLYRTDLYPPATKSPRADLDVHGRLEKALEAVGPNGGRVVRLRHSFRAGGVRVIIDDSEGNRIALHSA